MIGKHSATLKMGNHSSQHMYIFHYTSLKVQKVQLTLQDRLFLLLLFLSQSFGFTSTHDNRTLWQPS